MNDLRARVDELGKKVRGIDELEKRVAKLEKELAALKRAQKRAAAARPKPAGGEAASPRSASSPAPSDGAPPVGRRCARHAQPQRPRQHLEPRRRRAGLLAVELDRAPARPSRP